MPNFPKVTFIVALALVSSVARAAPSMTVEHGCQLNGMSGEAACIDTLAKNLRTPRKDAQAACVTPLLRNEGTCQPACRRR